jgi:hypothetical protein
MPDLTGELQRLADDAARHARPLPADDVIRHGNRRRRRSTMWQALSGLSAAGIVAAVVLVPASHQPRHHPPVQLAAWTVTKLPNGDIRVHIFKLRHPATLQRKLRAEGVPASVVTNPPGPCRRYPASRAVLNRVFPGSYRLRPPPGNVIVIHPSALPHGTGVQLAGSFHRPPAPGFVAAPILVHASPRCTQSSGQSAGG